MSAAIHTFSAVERFTRELDACLSDTAFSGLKQVQSGVMRKLSQLEGTAGELGMAKGAALLGEFAAALREYRTGESGAEKAAALLCRLDFYNKNLTGNMEISE